MRPRWRLVLGLAGSAGLLAVAVAWAEPRAVLAALARTRPGWLLAAVGLSLASNGLQSAELVRQALRVHGAGVSYRTALAATVANMALQNLLPAGLGQASRAMWLHRAAGVERVAAARAALTVLGAKVAGLGLLAAIGLGWGSVAVGVAGLAVAAAVVARGLAAAAVAVHAVLATGAEVLLLVLSVAAVGGRPDGLAALAPAAAVLVAARVPGTPGGFGARELAAVAAFGPVVGPGTAAAGAALFGAVERLLPTALGSLAFPWFLRGLEGRRGSAGRLAEGEHVRLDDAPPVVGRQEDRVGQ